MTFPRIPRAIGNALIWMGFKLTNKFPTEEEIYLRAIFGESSSAEAEGGSRHIVCDGNFARDLHNQNAIRRSMMAVAL